MQFSLQSHDASVSDASNFRCLLKKKKSNIIFLNLFIFKTLSTSCQVTVGSYIIMFLLESLKTTCLTLPDNLLSSR